ncbi:MAG: hypothetical protein LPK38_04415, partial [Actinomycetes bacterium]|nr:hypothetical protein [Actinomycetes bacterium]MDX5399414.1 hypothetical protein [Actinomycetes bacterium]MDX5450272.1 hypothetical protein [Actinomycetes bacterium]
VLLHAHLLSDDLGVHAALCIRHPDLAATVVHDRQLASPAQRLVDGVPHSRVVYCLVVEWV